MDTTHLDSASPAPRSPSDPLHELRSLGEYRILRRLGEGGMGFVYLGYHEGQDAQVAIKVLADHLASNQAFVDRFYREAKNGQLLNHPNIVRTLTVGQDRATHKHYLVLEFVDGPSIHQLLDRFGKLSVGDAVHIVLDVARALEYAHSRNIVHRDIKPDNVLVTQSGVAKLADLGLAKRTDEASHLTATKQGFGTPHYMPYEQAMNAKYADGRSDVYALGATLYHLVTGAVPFAGVNHLEVVEKKNEGVYAPASELNPEVPRELDVILAKMLARQPRDRYQTASELIVDLERSGLSAPVPSFVDPQRAMADPWVQECLRSSSQPTRPDLEAPLVPKSDGAVEVWLVRFRGADGRWVKARRSTEQVLELLREGRLPVETEACRATERGFKVLSSFPEFADVTPLPRKRRKPKPAEAPPEARPLPTPPAKEPPEPPPAPRGTWIILLGVGVFLAAGVATVIKLVVG